MRRIKLIIEYVGTNYNGWQKQKNGIGIQEILEKAILKSTGEEVEIFGAGRTDAGVHALGQVAHFDTNSKIQAEKYFYVLNKFLPEDIKIVSSCEVKQDFHSRFSAKQKTYLYKFYASDTIHPLKEFDSVKIGSKFDYKLAKKSLKYFKGTHDFVSFCSSNTNVKDTTRTIFKISLTKQKDEMFLFSICGNGFLYNMVRIIVGTIIEIGQHTKSICDINKMFEQKDRTLAGKTMPAKGLTLKEVKY